MSKEIIEGNCIIAEFDDNVSQSFGTWFYKPKQHHFLIEDAEYHSSWDWLMPVYIKIQNIKVATSHALLWGKYCGGIVRALATLTNDKEIIEVHRKIILALTWYNANIPKQ